MNLVVLKLIILKKAATILALTEVEILALRIGIVVFNCLVLSNDRLQRMAGMTFTKNA